MKKFLLVILISVLSFSATSVMAVTKTASVSGNWSNTATWGGAAVPVAGDNIIINSGVTVTVDVTTALVTTVVINASSTFNGIAISGTNVLNCGAITMNSPTAAVNSAINVGTGTLNATSIAIPGSATANQVCMVFVSTGTINITGSITFSGTAAQAQLTFMGAGTLNIGGTLSSGGTFTRNTGTVNFNGGNQTLYNYAYYNVTLSGSGTKSQGVSIVSIYGALTVKAGTTLSKGTYTIGGTTPPTSLVLETGGTFVSSITGTGLLTLGGNVTVNNLATGISGASIACPISLLSATRTFTVADNPSTVNDLTISGVISTTGSLTKAGSGTLMLSNVSNTYTGTTTITAGELKLNPISIAATAASQYRLNGGTFSTTGIAANTVWTNSSTLNLNASSSITLGANVHTLKFANSSAITWGGITLTINGWTGTAGGSGTSGKIFIGTDETGLSLEQLAKINFTGYTGGAQILPNGEIVPKTTILPIILYSLPSLGLTLNSAILGGTILSSGSSVITERGIYWSTSSGFANGTGTKVSELGAFSTGAFTLPVSGLTSATTYYFKVFATNNSGTVYSSQATFKTFCVNSSLPYSQGFNITSIPDCWGQQYVIGTSSLQYVASSTSPTTSPQEGTDYIMFNSFLYAAGKETRLVYSPLTTIGTASIDVEFYWFNENSASYNSGTYLNEGVQVQYSLDNINWTSAGSFISRNDANFPSGTGQWNKKTITVPAGAGNQPTLYVGFKFHSEFGDNCSMDAVTIKPTSACIPPTTVSTSSITANSCIVSWNASETPPLNGYQIYFSTSPINPIETTIASAIVEAGVTSYNLNSLTSNTTYYVWVRSDCGGGDLSSWTNLVSFKTPCGYTSIPYSQNFNATSIPACWSEQYVVGSSSLQYVASSTYPTTTPQEGADYVMFNSHGFTAGNETRLVAAPITSSGTPFIDVEFYWYNENSYGFSSYLNEGVQVQYSLDNNTWVNAGSFIPRYDASLASGTGLWKKKTITLPAGAGNQPTIYIGFKFHSEYGANCSMDAVTIKASPSCVPPNGVNTSSITATSATISWTASVMSPSNGYQIYYSTSPTTPTPETIPLGSVGAGITNYTINSLTKTPTIMFGFVLIAEEVVLVFGLKCIPFIPIIASLQQSLEHLHAIMELYQM